MDNEGIGGLNALAYQFYTYDVDTEKLDAAIEMTGVTSSKNIITLINYLDDLELITDIDKYDFAGVGRYYLDQSTDLEISRIYWTSSTLKNSVSTLPKNILDILPRAASSTMTAPIT